VADNLAAMPFYCALRLQR